MLEAAIALKSARFVKAATKPLKELTKDNGSRTAKMEKNIFITSVITSIVRAAEKARARGVALYVIIRLIYYFV